MILTIERFAETVAAARSALRQIGVGLHVTVLDQGSRFETRRQFAEQFKETERLSYYVTERNLGVGGGRNMLAGLGHGKVIIGLDNDAVFEDETVACRTVAAFAQTPELGALGFRIMAADGVRLDEFSWGYPAGLKPRYRQNFNTTTFVGAGHAIRRATWMDAGGYDADLFFTWEEYDFCLAAIARDWVIRYDGSIGVIHKISPEARVTWSASRITYFVRNRLIIARKWGASWAALAPRIIVYGIRGLLSGRLAATMRGIAGAIRGDAGRRKQKMSRTMRQYCYQNETSHRGSILQRVRFEVLAKINTDGLN